jgi:hypothetical protein
MSDTAHDLKNAFNELATALKPLEGLTEAMRGLDRSHRLQADLQLIEQYYPEAQRNGLYAILDEAHQAEAYANETLILRNKRNSDQRSFEQYSRANGPEQAKMAFMSDDEFNALCDAAKKKKSDLRAAHPVLFRVYAQIKTSW